MKWVFRYYTRALNQVKDPLPSRDYMSEFYFQTNAKEFEKNIKQQGFPSDLQENVK